jgi:hypothetical protein
MGLLLRRIRIEGELRPLLAEFAPSSREKNDEALDSAEKPRSLGSTLFRV